MTGWTFFAIPIGYILIAVLVAGIMAGLQEYDMAGLIAAFWPISIATFIVVIILAAPFKLGEWIGNKFR